jgi:integrase
MNLVRVPALLEVPLAGRCEGKGRDYLGFATRHGSHQRRTHNAHGWFPVAVAAAGLRKLTRHSLRHTAASSGAKVKAVQRMLGHASASMTLDVYAELFNDDLDAIAGRLDEGLANTVVGKMWAELATNEEKTR